MLTYRPLVVGDQAVIEVRLRATRDVEVQATLNGPQNMWGQMGVRTIGGQRGVEDRPARGQVRIVGWGQGTVTVSEKTFWSEAARTTVYPVAGDFRLRHP